MKYWHRERSKIGRRQTLKVKVRGNEEITNKEYLIKRRKRANYEDIYW